MKLSQALVFLVVILGLKVASASKVCTLTGSVKNTEPKCPEGWVMDPDFGDCYLLNKSLHTFDEAKEYCHSLGASMVSISSEEEQSFITAYVILDQDLYNHVWLGAKRMGTGGATFGWLNGATFSRYSNWFPGEPNYSPQAVGREEDCLQMVSAHHWGHSHPGAWNDMPCTDKMAVLCQMTLESTAPTFEVKADCPGKDFLIF